MKDTNLQEKLGVFVEGDMLMTRDKQMCVPNLDSLRYKITLEEHEPPDAGHFGKERTLAQLRKQW